MNGKPDKVEIRVKDTCGTYVATCKEVKVRATCTMGYDQAARACAEKIYGSRFSLERHANGSGVFTAMQKANGAWRADLPDDEITVAMRKRCEENPISIGSHLDGCWWIDGVAVEDDEVTGWMHLHEAARILDAYSAPSASPRAT
jgi:hypothetical protein